MSKYNRKEDLTIINNYFRDINSLKVELLTPEDEVRLAERIQAGDEEALKELAKANLKFVVSIAHDYKGKGIPLSDLVSEGNYGLMKAAQRFDHTRGFRFISYAVWWIKQSILQCLNEHARTIRLPVNILNKVYQLQKELNENKISNVESSLSDLDYMDKLPKCSSLNFFINEDGDELSDVISEEPYKTYDEHKEEDNEIKSNISECLEVLDEREKDIVTKYYGLNNIDPLTLEVIGDEYGLTKERVRQIKSKAIKKLKYNLISIIKAKQ
jgi:RNA polymerase primary sigma factor